MCGMMCLCVCVYVICMWCICVCGAACVCVCVGVRDMPATAVNDPFSFLLPRPSAAFLLPPVEDLVVSANEHKCKSSCHPRKAGAEGDIYPPSFTPFLPPLEMTRTFGSFPGQDRELMLAFKSAARQDPPGSAGVNSVTSLELLSSQG